MKGANEYATLFDTQQIGRLYLVSGSHARGKTFRIYVLPEGEAAKSNGSNNAPLNNDAVCVYGVTGGQRGWTETYGWLHKGKWQDDFEAIVAERREEIRLSNEARADSIEQQEIEAKNRKSSLLATY